MRKFMISLLAISFFIVTLCGCRQDNVKSVCTYFCADAVICADDKQIDVKLSSTIGQNVTLSLLTGDATKGMSYRVANSTMYIEYGELSCVTKVDYLPDFCYADVVLDTLLSIQKTAPLFNKEHEMFNEYKVKTDNGDVLVFADKKSGYITKIKPLYTDCEIKLRNVQEM